MDRRDFLRGSATALAGLAQASAQSNNRAFAIENKQLIWRMEAGSDGVRSVSFENRITGSQFALTGSEEFAAVFSASPRIEIPWWEFRSREDAPWGKSRNLAGGQRGRRYDGPGWFRHQFELPETAKGQELIFVLGGYDEQDWNEHRVLVNDHEIGQRSVSGRWRVPGRHSLKPGDAAYGSLRFGSGATNVLTVQARGYDYQLGGLSGKALDRYVFHPYLFDQFISIGEPYRRLTKFELRGVNQPSPEKISFQLHNAEHQISATLHFELDGFLRRKWIELQNASSTDQLLLDVVLDDFETRGESREGGHGKPVFLNEEAFLAIEHPAGINQGTGGHIKLWHCPGRKIAAGKTMRSRTAIVGAAPREDVTAQFHRYLLARSPRTKKKRVSIFTCYGVNNQWGGCGTLADSEVLDTQQVIRNWQAKGVKLDYFTLDTGWPQNDGDFTEFVATCYPDGPDKIVQGVDALGMKFGLWFSVSWGGWANGSYPAVQESTIPEPGDVGTPTAPPVTAYRNGYPTRGGIGRQLCIGSDPYARIFRNAIVHHVRNNKARLVKFDSGNYYCNSTKHGHLPGKYSTEAMHDSLIETAKQARVAAPDVFVTWYWGAGSPFWALHGDVISESGLFMEGSGTSWFPTLYYRDSVTLSLDQTTQFASLIPPMNKDSIGVWLSQIRWANFMGKERWRESLVMDLARGNMVFPQLWGDPRLLNDDDLRFLANIIATARNNESVFLQERHTFGDSWKNDVYGYSFFNGGHGFIFCNNVHFTSRKVTLPLGPKIGLNAPSGTPIRMTAHFPERAKLVTQAPLRSGGTAEFWLRPFETLMLEVGGERAKETLPLRKIDDAEAARQGASLPLRRVESAPWMELTFADAARFEQAGMRPSKQSFASRIPRLDAGRSVLAIAVSLANQNGTEFRYKPVVVEIVQLRCRVGGREIQLVPVPDARQFGNTQSAGCSWVLYKIPLADRHFDTDLEFAVHTYLPNGVEARAEAWLTRQWWKEKTRPEADGYYGDAPS